MRRKARSKDWQDNVIKVNKIYVNDLKSNKTEEMGKEISSKEIMSIYKEMLDASVAVDLNAVEIRDVFKAVDVMILRKSND